MRIWDRTCCGTVRYTAAISCQPVGILPTGWHIGHHTGSRTGRLRGAGRSMGGTGGMLVHEGCMTETPQNTSRAAGWLLLVYRVPSEPSHKRVAVWRDLKRIGALYLQHCVCVVPRQRALRTALTGVRAKIATLGGTSNLFEIPRVSAEDAAALIKGFRDLIATQYAEIVEECETKFVKEVEFEKFRQNYSFSEAEEIAHDLEKMWVWFARVQAQDWFDAPGRDDVATWHQRCELLLDDFYTAVHTRAMADA